METSSAGARLVAAAGRGRSGLFRRGVVALGAAAVMLTGIVAQAPSSQAEWGAGGFVTFAAFTEDGVEFNIQGRNTFGSDGRHVITGAFGTRSASWIPGPDSAPDTYPRLSSFFIDNGRGCFPEETYPESLASFGATDYWGGAGGPCWGYSISPATSEPGPWGYAVPIVADGPDGADLVFDHWVAPEADVSRCYTGDVGIIGDGGLRGANGAQVAAVGFRGYVDVFNPDPAKTGSFAQKAIYAPMSPDTSAPVVTIQSDLDCMEVEKGSVVTATYSCVDPGDVDPNPTCVGPTASGAPIDTSTLGTHPFTVTGTDSTGNSRTITVHYTVVSYEPTISVGDVTVVEGDSGTTDAIFTVSLDGVSDDEVTVDFATATGTAGGADFVAMSGTLTFAPGETTKTASVAVIGESNFENAETFTLALSNPVNGQFGASGASGTGTIIDDDPAPTVSIESVTSVVEGNTGTTSLLFDVSLSAPLERPGYVFATRIIGGTATAGEDYTPLPDGTADQRAFTFGPDGKAVIPVEVLGDTDVEADETVVLEIQSLTTGVPGLPSTPLTVTNGTSMGTIVNDDGPPPSWFEGFVRPVDPLPTVNSLKAGQAVPIKFSLGGDRGLGIFNAGSPSTQRVSCQTSAPTDALEETVTAGASGLKYDTTTGLYTYTWKTSKAWAGTCRIVTLDFVDGTTKTVKFQLR